MQNIKIAISFITCVFLLASCSDTVDPKELEPKELKPNEAKLSDKGEQELLDEAQRYYGNELFSLSREKFSSLIESYPSSTYREFAELKIADTFFESTDYKDAAKSYETFQREHPASSSAPYALLKAGRSYQLAFKGVGKDTSPLDRALEIYNSLIEKHPDSIYAPTAKEYRAEVQKFIAEQEQFVSSYYASREKGDAAAAREKEYSNKIKSIDKNAMVLRKDEDEEEGDDVEVSESDSSDEEASLAAENTETAEESNGLKLSKNLSAPSLLTAEVVEQARPKSANPVDARAGLNAGTDRGFQNAGQNSNLPLLTRIECSFNGTPTVTLFLNKPLTDKEFLDDYSNVKTSGGLLELKVPVAVEKREITDCFDTRDLVMETDGTLTLNGIREANVMAVTAPARILLTVK